MTRPGAPPPRGRHAAPDGGARPDGSRRDEDVPPPGRHAAPDPPPRRRHAAPDTDAPHGVDPYGVNGHADGADAGHPSGGYPDSGYPDSGHSANGHHEPPRHRRRHAAPDDGQSGPGYQWPSNAADPAAGHHRAEQPTGWADQADTGYRWSPAPADRPDRAGHRHRRPEQPDEWQRPADTGHRWPGQADGWTGSAGSGDRWPGAHADRPEPPGNGYPTGAPPWAGSSGYQVDGPAPPAVNGYRLDEPVAPVAGFPYTAPLPGPPIAYPINGHGVDAAVREAASWPVDLQRTELHRPAPPTGWQREPVRPAYRPPPREDPPIAVVPLDDEATQALDRPQAPPERPAAPARRPDGTRERGRSGPHPPRAVVRRRRARRKALEWPFLIVFALVSAFLIRQYVVQTFYIPSASMHETLVEGDRVLVNKVSYRLHDVHRGDIVVFRKPPNLAVDEDDLIKRVVALPGERVEAHGGTVYVNGAPLREPYVEPLCHGTGDFGPTRVAAGTLWVMGDNRCNSSDSRRFGPIDEKLVVGRAFVLAWPFGRVSWL